MENYGCLYLIIVIVVWVIIDWIIKQIKSYKKNRQKGTTSQTSYSPNDRASTNLSQTRPTPPVFRPVKTPKTRSTKTRTKPKIIFNEISERHDVLTSLTIKDLHDALTGALLDKKLGLYQCNNCKVFYHSDSYKVLKEINSSQCVACHSLNISVVSDVTTSKFVPDYQPGIVTLKNYREYVGSVVTFKGYVHTVFESRRGNDFAVMFEEARWVSGFKLVFFRGDISKIGGRKFVYSLAGKTIEVRGLIIKHEQFGYEIVVSDKSMILSVTL